MASGANSGGGPQPDVLNNAWRNYGNRVGAWRLLELLDRLDLPATVLLNSAMYEYAPQLVSAITPDLLAEAGYRYTLDWCADDQPIWMRTRAGRLLAISYPQEVNDIPSVVVRKHGAERLEPVGCDDVPQVMGSALHPYIIGQPYRPRALRGVLAAAAVRRGKVWITAAGAIFDHVAALPARSVP